MEIAAIALIAFCIFMSVALTMVISQARRSRAPRPEMRLNIETGEYEVVLPCGTVKSLSEYQALDLRRGV